MDFDEMTVFPEHLRHEFNHTMFVAKGKCADVNPLGVTPSYMRVSENMWPGIVVTYENLNDKENTCSGSGSWVSGDVAVSAADVARFFYYYLGTEKIINFDTRAKLLNIDQGDEKSFPFTYGVGLLLKWYFEENGHRGKQKYENYLVGHPGMDYGSYSDSAGYNLAYNFSFVVATNTFPGLNCDLEGNEFWNNDQF